MPKYCGKKVPKHFVQATFLRITDVTLLSCTILSIKKYVVVSRFSLHVMKMQSKEEIMLLSPVIYPKKTMTYQYPLSPALTLA